MCNSITLHLSKLINLDKYTSASSVTLEHNRKLNDSNFVDLTRCNSPSPVTHVISILSTWLDIQVQHRLFNYIHLNKVLLSLLTLIQVISIILLHFYELQVFQL